MEYMEFQIIFSLNSVANSPSGQQGTVQELERFARNVVTQTFANQEVHQLIGRWSLVWGPAVYQAQGSKVADNSMYVAQCLDEPDRFVIAISGTNPISIYGWIHEDFIINPLQPWTYSTGCPSQAKISNGTKIGLDNLLKMRSGGRTLMEYLKEQRDMGVVTVTGHSLGGALSPALALALKNLQPQWNPASNVTINVMPTAGPTPGNKAWADYYDTQLGSTTERIWNELDIVPHAWELDMLSAIPKLYEPYIPATDIVSLFVSLAQKNSTKAGDMWQIHHDTECRSWHIDPSKTTAGIMVAIFRYLQESDLLEKIAKSHSSGSFTAADKEKNRVFLYDLIEEVGCRKSSDAVEYGDLPYIARHYRMSRRHDGTDKQLPDESSAKQLIDLVAFISQAIYQHTTAYAEILETESFEHLYNSIKKQNER